MFSLGLARGLPPRYALSRSPDRERCLLLLLVVALGPGRLVGV